MPKPIRKTNRPTRISRKAIAKIASEMESPLDDTFELLWALHLIGLGLNQEPCEKPGSAILVVVAAIFERFCAANERWHRLVAALSDHR